MNIYIAAASTEASRVEEAVDKLEALGYRAPGTREWLEHVRMCTGKLSECDAFSSAKEDLEAIEQARWLWFMRPSDGHVTRGAWVELGYAIGKDLYTLASGKRHDADIFSLCADHSFETDEEALRFFDRLASVDQRVKMPT